MQRCPHHGFPSPCPDCLRERPSRTEILETLRRLEAELATLGSTAAQEAGTLAERIEKFG